MKYIRTKDERIIKVDEIHQIDKTCEETYTSSSLGITFISPKDIVKQADTIKELCDEFVVICKEDNTHNFAFGRNYNKRFFEIAKKCIRAFDTYGAIWTDKGLIYVAKMNEKGELVLL